MAYVVCTVSNCEAEGQFLVDDHGTAAGFLCWEHLAIWVELDELYGSVAELVPL